MEDEEEKKESIFIKIKTGDENYQDALLVFRKNVDENKDLNPQTPADITADKNITITVKKDDKSSDQKNLKTHNPKIHIF